MKVTTNYLFISITLAICCLSACSKSNYEDGGTNNNQFNGSSLAYLKAHPVENDSLLTIIKLGGLENLLDKDDVTFFAPSLPAIVRSVGALNEYLYLLGQDTVKRLNQIDSLVWRKTLSNYIFSGKKSLNDYPQIDLVNKVAFPGQAYNSFGGRIMNLGVEYSNASGIQYAGLRTLIISYPISEADLAGFWYNARVATSNIHTNNGFIHIIRESQSIINGVFMEQHYYGFRYVDFISEATRLGIKPYKP